MRRLFFDANVLFTAAHNPDGKAAFLLELGGEGHWRCLTSALAIEEARRNLARKYPDSLARFNALSACLEMVPDQPAEVCPLALVEKDRPIFAAALKASATHLLTGDHRHFGAWMNRPGDSGGILVQTVSEFFASLD
ncbi:MAG: PIN domain-containing protein [Trichloromonadaceae bacterium]